MSESGMGRPVSWTEEERKTVLQHAKAGTSHRKIAELTGLSKSAVQRIIWSVPAEDPPQW